MAGNRTRRYELIHSKLPWDSTPPRVMESDLRANSKGWILQVMDIERRAGTTYRWYRPCGSGAEPSMIDRTRFRLWRRCDGKTSVKTILDKA